MICKSYCTIQNDIAALAFCVLLIFFFLFNDIQVILNVMIKIFQVRQFLQILCITQQNYQDFIRVFEQNRLKNPAVISSYDHRREIAGCMHELHLPIQQRPQEV